jgi:hypothetical protein
MFFIYRGCTPPEHLYGIIDRSISDDRGLYGPIGEGCMALQTVRGLYGLISVQEVFTFDSQKMEPHEPVTLNFSPFVRFPSVFVNLVFLREGRVCLII